MSGGAASADTNAAAASKSRALNRCNVFFFFVEEWRHFLLILERRHTHIRTERKEIPIDCRKSHPPPLSPLLPLFISFAPLLKSFARSTVNCVCVCVFNVCTAASL